VTGEVSIFQKDPGSTPPLRPQALCARVSRTKTGFTPTTSQRHLGTRDSQGPVPTGGLGWEGTSSQLRHSSSPIPRAPPAPLFAMSLTDNLDILCRLQELDRPSMHGFSPRHDGMATERAEGKDRGRARFMEKTTGTGTNRLAPLLESTLGGWVAQI